jgi:hypothetical protein
MGGHAPPSTQKKPVLMHRFFFARTLVAHEISRCGKFFCLVKNRAAWHNKAIAAGKIAFLNVEQIL